MKQDIKLVSVIDGEPRVSTQTISDRTGNQHASVIRLVRDNLSDLEAFGGVGFEIAPFQTAGGVQRREIAQLNEQQGTLLITFLRNTAEVRELKVALVREFYEMKQAIAGAAPALTEDEIVLQALQITNRKVKALEAKVAEDAPKVDYIDTFVADDDTLKFRTVAADLGIGEMELRNLLIRKGWIYKEHSKRWSDSKGRTVDVYRYSQYAAKKAYFYRHLEHDVPRFKGEVMWTLKITPAGAAAIARLIKTEDAA